jgi:dipeptidyl aminopeptidase/acylaminoacyl peptidase
VDLVKVKRTVVLLVLAGTVITLMGASVAQAGFRPGLIAFYKPDTGGIFVLATVCLLNVTTGVGRVLLSPTKSLQAFNTSVVSWSPRGDEIASDSSVSVPCSPQALMADPSLKCSDIGIASLDVKTGAPTLITDPAAFAEAPAFSPDGNEIVYRALASTASGLAGLDVMSASGRFLRNVAPASDTTCGGCGYIDPTWSPDGKKILFNSDPSRVGFINLFTVDANGGGDMTLVSESSLDIYESSWAPVVTTCTVPKLKARPSPGPRC